MGKPASPKTSSIKNSFNFLIEYFLVSDNKWRARFLFLGCGLGVLAVVGLGLTLGSWCFPFIYAAFIAKDVTLLLIGLGSSILIAGAMTGFNYLVNSFKNSLYVDWRSWLTKKMISRYLYNKTNYLDISRAYNELDNPEQRIQEDIDKVVESFLELSLGFVDNFINLIVYTVLLGLAGGSLAFMAFGVPIVIPGFLVLVALTVGITSSVIGYFINKSLQKSTSEEVTAQSNLRADLRQINTNAEEIAIEHAEKYYKVRLEKGVDEIQSKTTKKLAIQNRTSTFNLFNSIFQVIVPFIVAAPIYFNDVIGLDAFLSVGYYFSMITKSLNWFMNSFEMVNKFQTSLNRVVALQEILDKNKDLSTQKIFRSVNTKDKNLIIHNLDLKLQSKDQLVIKGLSLEFTPGLHTLIKAPSGAGKSSLFKAIAGTWLTGEGEINIPNSLESIYFLPQKPTLPNDTLRKVLAYPDPECNYSDGELILALKAVNMEKLSSNLNEQVGFKSLGEQQRIAFARVLLRKPDWVFLDEATASLDEETEEQVYYQLKKLLPKTTIISIAHRSTVKRHHDNLLFFNVNVNKEVEVIKESTLAETELYELSAAQAS